MEKYLKVFAKKEELEKVQTFIDTILEEQQFSMQAILQVDIAIEELFVNIVYYAYSDDVEEADRIVEVVCKISGEDTIEIELKDGGKEFNPLEKKDPDITASLEEREIGGLGIYMVKKSMDGVEYERKNLQNIIRIYKKNTLQ